MHNQIPFIFAGIDVSKDHLDVRLEDVRLEDVCLERPGAQPKTRRFDNDPDGHNALLQWLGTGDTPVRVCLEASGLYSLGLALALDAANATEVMVANPRAVSRFREALLERSKTDRSDAVVICAFARRMPSRAWAPPERAVLSLRAIARRIQALNRRAHAREEPPACRWAEPNVLRSCCQRHRSQRPPPRPAHRRTDAPGLEGRRRVRAAGGRSRSPDLNQRRRSEERASDSG